MTEADVIIVGAGVAGLAAARALMGKCTVMMLEASRWHIGGRAWTAYPKELGWQPFEMGPMWLHNGDNNPLTKLARVAGVKLYDDMQLGQQVYIGNRRTTPAEDIDYQFCSPQLLYMTANKLLADGKDMSLSDAILGDPILAASAWAQTRMAWEGPIISAADANKVSLRDWRDNMLGGPNLALPDGIGGFVTALIPKGLEIFSDSYVQRFEWNGPNGQVLARSTKGTARAKVCIVTASTGVLGSGAIHFEPSLPADRLEAIAGLPMGLTIKVAISSNDKDRLGLLPHTYVARQVKSQSEPFIPLLFWPYGRPHVLGWIGGSAAQQLAKQGDEALVDAMRCEIRIIFGADAESALTGPHVAVRWDQQPFVQGTYSYAKPGFAHARATLAKPLSDGHLIFAGEACHNDQASTLGGAWLSGQAAAAVALAALKGERI